jgi:hypothetical protein
VGPFGFLAGPNNPQRTLSAITTTTTIAAFTATEGQLSRAMIGQTKVR